MTEEQFQNAIATAATSAAKAAVEAAMSALTGNAPQKKFEDASPNDQFAAMMHARKQGDQPPIPVTLEECKSPDTGATFKAEIQRGIVFTLVDYAYPEGIEVHQSDGGIVPDRLPVKDPDGRYNPAYKQWRWTEFLQRDMRSFVGRPLPAYARVVTDKAAE